MHPADRAHRHHIHMNSTKWLTLTEFVKYLGREGFCRVDETPKGWFISIIQDDPMAQLSTKNRLKRDRCEAASCRAGIVAAGMGTGGCLGSQLGRGRTLWLAPPILARRGACMVWLASLTEPAAFGGLSAEMFLRGEGRCIVACGGRMLTSS